jgi:bifunctional DNase/RNase/anti-sigma regulatory factor (Ser/Thr protein kinase)
MSAPRIAAVPLRLELPAVPASVADGRHAVGDFCRGLVVDHDGVALAVSESVSNAVVHAYPDGARGAVRIFAALDGLELVVVVTDDGRGMTPRTDSPGMGIGLALIARLASSVEIDGVGVGARLAMRFARLVGVRRGAAIRAEMLCGRRRNPAGEGPNRRLYLADPREPEEPLLQEMVIYGVSFDMVGKQPIVLLKAVDTNKFLPIWIGHPEAAAILMKLQGASTPRPMTHDLLFDMLGELDVACTRVSVTELRENTFYASITLSVNGREVEIDSRPSDALALAVRSGAPIFAAEDVIAESAIEFEHEVEDTEEVVDKFKEFLDQVSPEDFQAGEQ